MRRWAIALLLGLSIAGADTEVGGIKLKDGPLDKVTVEQESWAWGSGAEKMPALSVRLRSGRFTYNLRHDQRYDNGRIGLQEPSTCNWYQSGMLDLLLDGRRLDLLPANHETLQLTSGRRGRATFSWTDARATVRYDFVLCSGQDRLLLAIDLAPKQPLRSLELRLSNYPGGFNRQPRHVARTPARALAPTGAQSLVLPGDCGLFLADETLDPADQPNAAGPSAVVFDPEQITAGSLQTGGYGVGIQLRCRPDARRLVLAFWEFPQTPIAEAWQRWQRDAAAALRQLRDPATFAP